MITIMSIYAAFSPLYLQPYVSSGIHRMQDPFHREKIIYTYTYIYKVNLIR